MTGWCRTTVWTVLLALAGLGVVTAVAVGPDGAPPTVSLTGPSVRYGRDIRPILSDRCFQCHGPDAQKREAGLRLDLREEALAVRKDGPAAIVPGQSGESELWRRVTNSDPDEVMPPSNSHKRALTDGEKALLKRWIDEGAAYEPHWSFVPPARPAVPQLAGPAAAWVRNPIDAFIWAGLQARGWTPSPEAPRDVLLRRVFLDLTGLPPTPDELDAFLADERPDAYERWVDKLLTEEPYRTRYAERMATPWMDQARYADTCGIHMDAGRQMWLWRDWVIEAYRSGMPFDRFVTEQLAGDLMPGASESQRIASGFNRNHVTTDEGGAIAEEYLVEYAVDRTATTSSVLLGLTVGCARCHDHKYDPVSTEDFYRLYAFFNSIEEPGLYSQTPDANRAYEPFMVVPTGAQKERLAKIGSELAELQSRLDIRTPEEETERNDFMEALLPRAGVEWVKSEVVEAVSAGGATMRIEPDGSVTASGTNPDKDDHAITVRTNGTGLRAVLLEALPEPTAFEGRLGRAPNGNAVLSGIDAEAVSMADPTKRGAITFEWAWADFSQQNGDFDITNVLDAADERGWALDAHMRKGGRVAVLVAREPFGFDGGTELRFRLRYQSRYAQHTLARVRLSVGAIGDAGLAMLPSAASRWYLVGPFPGDKQNRVYEPEYGPEQGDAIDLTRNFGFGNQYWRFDEALADGRVNPLADGRNVTYVGRMIYSPVSREVPVSLGSDDGFRLYVNGVEVAQNNTERSVMPDQDKAAFTLRPGRNVVVLKIVNTGGQAGFYWKTGESAELSGDLVAGLLPSGALTSELSARLERAWRVAFLPAYKVAESKIAALKKESDEINTTVPRTMVMKELDKPRETYVLSRGRYDSPDKARAVSRAIPAALGRLPDGAPANRLGLAQWMMSADNPLTARVTVNRLWELAFGTGLVRTSEDFGLQGEWPSHPELLDWLAVEFRETGWDTPRLLRLIVSSATYRQDSRVRAECRESDPDNRLLAYYPRRRLTAEQIRDQALYVSGLLVEHAGGPSVKPYQPEGLWQEVAMVQSNTREYKPGEGDEMWRRSLYTYWKRACPPPSLLTFDAPTREFCTIRRASTSTPLQALVLWNDEQFVEAARVLAQRTLKEPGPDEARLARMFRRCTGASPDDREAGVIGDLLQHFRERYRGAAADAAELVKVGRADVPEGLDAAELAAWTMTASTVMNLYRTTTQE
ncbi:MAG: PSD1 domain-containing protein [Phycisphaerales bacterium]|nr:PSD1 domain-containing protein [Phycisphaerales bacterium]